MPGVPEVRDRWQQAEPPPFLGTWKRVYIAVLIYLALLITICFAFTQYYAVDRALA